jgi:hypothetical protein
MEETSNPNKRRCVEQDRRIYLAVYGSNHTPVFMPLGQSKIKGDVTYIFLESWFKKNRTRPTYKLVRVGFSLEYKQNILNRLKSNNEDGADMYQVLNCNNDKVVISVYQNPEKMTVCAEDSSGTVKSFNIAKLECIDNEDSIIFQEIARDLGVAQRRKFKRNEYLKTFVFNTC